MTIYSRLSLTLTIVPLLLAGCVVDPDPDGDLLTTEFEESIGTDPENADSDGDGFEDGEEYVNYFSPTNDEDFPYTNADYPRSPLPDSDAWSALRDAADEDEDMGRGWDVGEFTKSFAGVDQYGDTLLLKRFYGEVLLIDVSAEWCPPCRAAALTYEEEWQSMIGEGVMFFTVLGDGLDTDDADASRWEQWPTGEFDGDAHPYGHPSNYGGEVGPAISSAILEDGPDDDTAQEVSRPWLDQTNAFPTFILIDRNHVITAVEGGVGDDTMEVVAEMAAQERPEVDYPLPENVDEVREAFPGAGSAN